MVFLEVVLIHLLWKIGILLSIVVVIISILLYVKQESLLYFPSIGGVPRRPSQNPRRYRSPSEHGIPFETHLISCADGTAIHSWLLYHPTTNNHHHHHSSSASQSQSTTNNNASNATSTSSTIVPTSRPTIIFFHGNAGNIGLRLPNAIQMYHTLNVHVWLIEYRGYGESDDVAPNEMGLKMDAEAVWNHVHTIHRNNNNKNNASNLSSSCSSTTAMQTIVDPRKMIVYGQSLGGAVAFHLAQYSQTKISSSSSSQPPPFTNVSTIKNNNVDDNGFPPLAGIIVENTFLSISKMVDHLMPYLSPIKLFILRMQWNTEQIVTSLSHPVPTLFMAGKLDTLVPHSHMLTLYERMKTSHAARRERDSRKDSIENPLIRLHVVENGTHNETWIQGGREYWRVMRQFLEEVFAHEMSGGGSGIMKEDNNMRNNHDKSFFAPESTTSTGIICESRSSSSTGTVGRGYHYGVSDGPFLRKASASSSLEHPLVGASSSTTASTNAGRTDSRKDHVEIELGGEDAADMISSVNSMWGMTREAATRTVGAVAVKGETGTYKKKE